MGFIAFGAFTAGPASAEPFAPTYSFAPASYAPPSAYALGSSEQQKPNLVPMFVRGSMGPTATFSDEVVEPGIAASATLGYRHVATPRLIVNIEADYQLQARRNFEGYYASLGAGPVFYQSRFFSLGYMPKTVLGGTSLGLSFGIRNSVVLAMCYQVFSVEVAHQWSFTAARDEQQLQVQAGFDLFAAFLLSIGTKPHELAWNGATRL